MIKTNRIEGHVQQKVKSGGASRNNKSSLIGNVEGLFFTFSFPASARAPLPQ
jgi:hypothetical protein